MTPNYRRIGMSLACLSMLTIQVAAAAAPATQSNDLALNAKGEIQGQVLEASGQPKANAAVLIQQGNRVLARVKTGKDGKFAAPLKPGVYQLICDGRGGNVRVWDSHLAPPKSHDSALIVTGDVERGKLGGILGNPLFLTAIVIAAIVTPIALDSGS